MTSTPVPNQSSDRDLKKALGESAPSNTSSPITRKPKKNKWQKSNNPTKVRVKLPPIESYQKDLEFPADAPGKVIVRLERLMGTDKIRITDTKYMSTLLERLEQEEHGAWLKRTRDRKLLERNRFRQLAVEGHMEPTADMQDLLQHPVYRVNRILNRLSKLDTNITLTPMKKLPPITPVEPFADNRSGGPIQYSYTPTTATYGEEEEDEEDAVLTGEEEEAETTGDELLEDESEATAKTETATENDEEWGGEDYPNSQPNRYDRNESLADAKLRYGIAASENIEAKCKPFRSKLVDLVFDDTQAVAEVNNYVAQFRDLLIHIGQSRDGPEMREKIRRMRRLCIDSCRHAVHLLLQQVRSDASEGIPADYSPQLVLLFFCTQLLCRELRKCRRLVMTLPVDMTSYYENKPGTSSLGGVLSQIILCRQLNPDFNAEELCSIDKDTVEISDLLDEMQEFMPKENTQTLALAGEDVFSKWARRRRKKTMYRNFGSLCCVSKSGRFTV